MTNIFDILDKAKGSTQELADGQHFRGAVHFVSEQEADALKLALAAKRPLLVRGEPGSGKSQLARVAAKLLGAGEPLVEVIHPRFEPSDLLYRFDAMARMLDAQLATSGQDGGWDSTSEKYIEKGILWQAFLRAAEERQQSVVLIDEIDKANSDLPNSLLDVLGNRSFDVPMRKPELRRVTAHPTFNPLVIFTTNEERELPAAFVRRCIVLNLNPPAGEGELRAWMLTRATAHALRTGIVSAEVVGLAVDQTLADRAWVAKEGFPKVGLAEIVDLLNALAELTEDLAEVRRPAEQRKLLGQLSAYGLVKHPVSDKGQGRDPIPALAQADKAGPVA
jgi:MoxR-like ATPase